jgi:enoyl-CoA hydratase/carnithine racemase
MVIGRRVLRRRSDEAADMSDSNAELVLYAEPEPGIGVVTLSSAHRRNAMTAELTAAWSAAMDAVRGNADLRAVVITGEGPAFCSGADLSWLDQGDPGDNSVASLRERMLSFYRAWLVPRSMSVPVIAAINGPAIGAGVALALACDLRYASTTAVFRTPFVQLGTHGGMAANWLLVEAVGKPRARELLFTARELTAATAAEWGLVTSVSQDPMVPALQAARQIAAAAPIATQLTKAGLNQDLQSLEAAVQWDAFAQPLTMATSDIHEGIRAIRERRPPRFDGQ